MFINRRFFFDQVRLSLFSGKLRQSQVSGLTVLLDYWESKLASEDDRWLAYVLGTVHHEVDRTMQPIEERGGDRYFFRMYDIEGDRPRVARRLGNTVPGDGVKFHGRGYVQITGRKNYTLLGDRLSVDLVNKPELALETDIAAEIIFYGMVNGLFTGKSLEDYFSASKDDWVNARRIVNGRDRANLIADYSQRYYAAISYRASPNV